MIEYIKGQIVELYPTQAVIECSGIGYIALISLQTYSALQKGPSQTTLYIHHYLREDEELYYGFATTDERELFRLLTSVSGIGAGTARMMLSSLSCDEIRHAIITSDVNRIKSIKGIGLKTAQRLILELKDKIVKGSSAPNEALLATPGSSLTEEATTALVMLGFTKPNVTKALGTVLREHPGASLEELIKYALKRL